MYPTRIACRTLLLALACAAATARADLYKWVDEHGRVTYTNVPSPEAKSRGRLERVAVGASAVSTYSSEDSTPAADRGGATAESRVLQERIARLERELELERRARALASEMTAGKAAAEAKEAQQRQQALRARCLADRRIDCDRADLALEDSPAVLMVARPPQVIRQLIVQPLIVPPTAPHHPPHLSPRSLHPSGTRPAGLRAPDSPWGLGTAPRVVLRVAAPERPAVPPSGLGPRPVRRHPAY